LSHSKYRLVRLRSGVLTIHSSAHNEKMHPGPGPSAEAEQLHIGQAKIRNRLQNHTGEFVVWDVGLGAAANALTLLRLTRDRPCPLRLVSFDDTVEPLLFALLNADTLEYLRAYESAVKTVTEQHRSEFKDGAHIVNWEMHVTDFPSLISREEAASVPKPHAILFDPFSPAKNPAMWTLPVFENLFHLLDPARPCALTTYSRSTMIRVSLLLAGFFVGRGRPTGMKEETTVAANTPDLLDEPLDAAWLQRARKSTSAEPLTEASYRQSPLSTETCRRLRQHAQFA